MTISADSAVALARLRADMASGRAREVRERARLSQAEVAEAVGVTQPTVAGWESGRRKPHGDRAARYADLLARLEQAGKEC
jgi:transcriptional regulator with XRE-family HTH domain